jgi:hypothetical protein
METAMKSHAQSAINGRRCRLLKPICDRQGRIHFGEVPIILRELVNLGWQMFLVEFGDRSTTCFSRGSFRLRVKQTRPLALGR